MKHCLWELCETQYDNPSVFEDFECCGACVCVCVCVDKRPVHLLDFHVNVNCLLVIN